MKFVRIKYARSGDRKIEDGGLIEESRAVEWVKKLNNAFPGYNHWFVETAFSGRQK